MVTQDSDENMNKFRFERYDYKINEGRMIQRPRAPQNASSVINMQTFDCSKNAIAEIA